MFIGVSIDHRIIAYEVIRKLQISTPGESWLANSLMPQLREL